MSSELQVDYDAALDAIHQLLRTASAQGLIIEATFRPLYNDAGVIVARQIDGLRMVTVPGART